MPKIQTTRVYSELQQAVSAGYTTVSAQGGSRSGKTTNVIIWLIVYLLSHPGTRLSIVRKTFPSIKGSVFIDFRDSLIRMERWNEKALNKNDFIYQFPNGSWVEFFSCDSEQKLRGRKRDILFVNEANELSPLEWQQLKMRTAKFSIIDYNPSITDEHWIVGVNNDPRTYHFVTTYRDNPFLEQTIIDEIESLRFKNKSLWQVYGLGLQAAIEGLIFPNVEIVDEIPAYVRKRYRGMDFGFHPDPTAMVDVWIHGDELYVDELCYRTEMLSRDIINELRSHDGRIETICESADPRLIEEVYRGGCNVHKVIKYPGSVEAGILKMQEFKIRITSRSVNAIKEFRNYVWAQDKEGRWLNIPAKGFGDHIIDSVRYVILMKILGGKRKPLNMTNLANIAH